MHRHASLNRIYRLVWSHVHQTWIVVAETARGRGKRANRKLLLAAAALASAQLAQAGPTGGQVTAGQGAIQQAGNTTTVTQGSQNLALSWKSFDTAAAETVNFVQPSSSAIAVNRILDTNGTRFFGKLNANGQVVLINPNGVLFGAGAQVNVGGLVASTLDLDERDLAGAVRRFSGDGSGSIVNRGDIHAAEGGYVAFLGNTVSNQGTITAPAGTVALGAGSAVTLSFAGNGLVKMQVERSTLDNLAENGGLVRADGGAVVLSAGARDAVLASVVNNTGVIEARSVRNVNGSIVLDGGQQSTATNSGTLDASGRNAGATGGSVKVLGEHVVLAAGSRIDVTGDAGGGSALVGGNFVGAGPERNARDTSVAAGSLVEADALSSGGGGSVAVWSDGTTRFDGRISARGGAAGGDGGQVETSGHALKVGAGASVNTLAARGKAGDWLLDPVTLTIGDDIAGNGDITGQQVTDALTTSSVTIKTGAGLACPINGCTPTPNNNDGDIILADGARIGGESWNGNTKLTLSAYNNVELRGTANIDANYGSGSIELRADNTGKGSGTVKLSQGSSIFGNASGTVSIFYNPTSYATPTDYAALMDADGADGYPLIRIPEPSRLQTYMLINFGGSIGNKTYDGNTTATHSGLAPLLTPANVVIDTDRATAAFLTKDAGNDKPVLISGVTIDGADAGKYYLNGLDSKTATIAKADLVLSGITANGKTYDGNTAATLSGTAAVSSLAGDVVSVSGTGTGTFFDKNAGLNKQVTVGGYTLTGTAAGNYNLVMPTDLRANIAKADLHISGLSANNKTYDGGTAASLSGAAFVMPLGLDVIGLTGSASASFADKNVGSAKAVTVSGYGLTGTDAINYNLVQPSGLTATITKADLQVTGIGAADKTYDRSSAATLTGNASVNRLGQDDVRVTGTGSGSFADRNAGSGKAVTVTGYSLIGDDSGNYNVLQPAGVTATIHKANLSLGGITANNKTYDGTTAVTLAGTAAVNPLPGDAVSVSGSGAGSGFASKTAGNAKQVIVAGYTLSGTDAANYNLVMPTQLVATIRKADLAITGVHASDKTYDGTSTALLGGTPTVSALGSDEVSVGGSATGVFSSKNAGSGKTVTATGFVLGGADAGNYNIVQPTGLTASIAKADLVVSGLSAAGKTYDGNASATLAGNPTITPFGTDDLVLTGSGSASFADKRAGAGKAVMVSGFGLSGLDAANYNLVQPSGLSATIERAPLLLTGLSVADKTYDGTTSAVLGGTATVSALGNDVVILSGSGSASFGDKTAGAGKPVLVGGYSLAGTDAANYTLVQPSGLSATIRKADLVVTGISARNKTYDGSTVASLDGHAEVAALAGDEVSVAGNGSAVFASKDAGSGKPVSVGGFTLAGGDAGNYNIVQPSGLTADIGKASLVVGGVSGVDKVYDGGTAATLSGAAFVAAFGNDAVSVTGEGNAVFNDKNAGANKILVVSGYALDGADAGNYTIVQPTGLTATIARADLVLGGIGVNGKTYDGTTGATLHGTAFVDAIGSDAVNVVGSGSASFADKNAGSAKAASVSGFTLDGLDAANYNLVMPAGLAADIGKASVAVTGLTANDKTYDGGTAATLRGSAAVAGLGNDDLRVAGSGTASFADKNAGSGKAVVVGGYTLAGADAGNYDIVQPSGLRADIAKASLSVEGVRALDKVYDGGTGATLAGTASVTAFGNDAVAVEGKASATFADKNAGAGKAVGVVGYTLAGQDAGNYALVQPAGLSATIHKAGLAVGGLHANGKTYDGSTAATLGGSAFVNAIGTDAVQLTGSGSASFADKNAGGGKAVSVTGYGLAGQDAANYELLMPTGLTADIARASLAVTGLQARGKTYDGGTAAALSGTASVAAIAGDELSLAGTATASFADKNAGSGKAVTVKGFTLAGADAANYALEQPAGLSADIGKAQLTVRGLSANNKVYDGGTAATLAGTATVDAIAGDQVTVAGSASAAFADKNAGAGKAVSVSGFTLTGADAGNYTLAQPAGLSATIDKASLAVQGLGASGKTYDGTVAATLTGRATLAPIAGDDVGLAGSATASFADKNAGSGKAVTVSGYTLAGTDAGNYTLLMPAGLTADIGKASLALTGLGAKGKTYDGSTAATLSGTASVAAIAGDQVALAGSATASFADKNAGSGKAVTVSGYTLAGTDAGNYTLLMPAGLSADIARASLAVTGLKANGKTYDGGTAATLSGQAAVAAIAGDQVALAGSASATFADKNAGAGKAVTVTGLGLTGADAGNYILSMPAGLSADIAKASLAVTGVKANAKTYDGSTAATLSGQASVRAIAGDQVSVAGSGSASFADKNAGSGKAVSVGGYTLAGADAGNYMLVQPSGLSADITPARLVLSGITASDKTWDGSTAASVSTAGAQLAGRVAGDMLTLSSRGEFADPAVGTGKTVVLHNTVGGADAGNYTVVDQASALASIGNLVDTPVSTTLRNTVAQLQSSILAPQTATPGTAAPNGSAGDGDRGGDGPRREGDGAKPAGNGSVLAETRIGAGIAAPRLRIQNGGLQLPPLAINTAE